MSWITSSLTCATPRKGAFSRRTPIADCDCVRKREREQRAKEREGGGRRGKERDPS